MGLQIGINLLVLCNEKFIKRYLLMKVKKLTKVKVKFEKNGEPVAIKYCQKYWTEI